jgi:hypothetical protein
MSIKVIDELAPKGAGVFPILDDQHLRGGIHVVANATARDAIPAGHRKIGMFAVTQDDNKLWQLNVDLVTWIEFAAGGGATGPTGSYGCPITVSVLDVVYLSSANTVDQADADDVTKRPLVGIVIAKPTTTSATVLYYGELDGFTGLTPGDTYYLSTTPGQLTATAPTASGSIQQRVGFARSTTRFVLMIDRDWVEI